MAVVVLGGLCMLHQRAIWPYALWTPHTIKLPVWVLIEWADVAGGRAEEVEVGKFEVEVHSFVIGNHNPANRNRKPARKVFFLKQMLFEYYFLFCLIRYKAKWKRSPARSGGAVALLCAFILVVSSWPLRNTHLSE